MQTTLVTICLCALLALPVAAQIPVPPSGTLSVECRLDNAPYQYGKIYVDGQEAGHCPSARVKLGIGQHTVRAGTALGNNRYLAYENEQVEVRKDATQNIEATLAPGTAENFASLVYAMGARQYSIRPPEDTKTGAFSPDGAILAVGAETNSVQLYNAADGLALRRLGNVGEYWVSFVTALCFSRDGQRLASNGWLYGSYTGEINIWDVRSGKLARTIPGVKGVSSLAFSPDGHLLAAGVAPNTIKVWNVNDGHLLWSLPAPGGSEKEINPLIFSADGQLLIAGHQAGRNLYIYDALTSKYRDTLPGSLVTLDNAGSLVTCLSKDEETIRSTWRLPAVERIELRQIKNGSIVRCLNEQILVAASGSATILDTRNEQLMGALNHPNRMALSADGRRILFYADGGYTIWSLLAIPSDPQN